MKHVLGIFSIYATLLCVGACASASVGTASDRVVPPEAISLGTPPVPRVPRSSLSGQSSVKIEFEVLVDVTGRPDMSTFKVMGPGAAENRDELARWMAQITFRPAHHGDQPVPGVFHGKLQASRR